MTTEWAIDKLDPARVVEASQPRLAHGDIRPAVPALYLWDPWPIVAGDGSTLRHTDGEWWMGLGAPRSLAPDERHHVARIWLLSRRGDDWEAVCPVFAEGSTPGSREWAGTAQVDDRTGQLRIRFTATGFRAEVAPSYAQRIVECAAPLDRALRGDLEIGDAFTEVGPQVDPYASTLAQRSGEPGFILGFRDPSVLVATDTADDVMFFTASHADHASVYAAVIGAARRDERGRWVPSAPVVSGSGVTTEMERPHVVRRGGFCYLFFSTQARTFHQDIAAPTGLYGFVADTPAGPWEPLNDSGLVLCNPPEDPSQCYSWMVLDDGSVMSFIDQPIGPSGAPTFVGTPGPVDQLVFDGAEVQRA